MSLSIYKCVSLMALYTLLVVLDPMSRQNSVVSPKVCLISSSDLFWSTCPLPNPCSPFCLRLITVNTTLSVLRKDFSLLDATSSTG